MSSWNKRKIVIPESGLVDCVDNPWEDSGRVGSDLPRGSHYIHTQEVHRFDIIHECFDSQTYE